MQNIRTYGDTPYTTAVIHGGPGAPGSVATVARDLAAGGLGVLEPLQTAASVDGQVAELVDVLREVGQPPVTLIGWSWGAWLSFITAARHPDVVCKLILVSSGPFEAQYASQIMPTRFGRLSDTERSAVDDAFQNLDDPDQCKRDAAIAFIGNTLKYETDSYDLMADPEEGALDPQADIHNAVWAEAAALRKSGDLLALGERIQCPVIAIHGEYDPHPAAGVQEPLAAVLADFRMEVLPRCGHYPWQERHARDAFYELLCRELIK